MKMNGSSSPCAKRQAMSMGRFTEAAASSVGMTSSNAAPAMKRLRPKRSEMAPMSGATAAVAASGAVTVRPVCAGVACSAAPSTGSSAWVHHMLLKVRNPAAAAAMVICLEPPLKNRDDIARLRQCKKWGAILGRSAARITRHPDIILACPVREPSGD